MCNYRSSIVQFPSRFFSIRLVSIHVVLAYSRIETIAAWKKLRFISSDRYDFCMINKLAVAVRVLAWLMFTTKSTVWIIQEINEENGIQDYLYVG